MMRKMKRKQEEDKKRMTEINFNLAPQSSTFLATHTMKSPQNYSPGNKKRLTRLMSPNARVEGGSREYLQEKLRQ